MTATDQSHAPAQPTSLAPTCPCILVRYSVMESDLSWGIQRSTVLPASPHDPPEETAAALVRDGSDVFWPPYGPATSGTDWGSVMTVPNVLGDGRTGYALDLYNEAGADHARRIITIDAVTVCENAAELAAATSAADDAGYPSDGSENAELPWTEHQWIGSHQWAEPSATTGTDWAASFVGEGATPRKACEDALQQAADAGWHALVSLMETAVAESHEHCTQGEDDDPDDHAYYVALYVNATK